MVGRVGWFPILIACAPDDARPDHPRRSTPYLAPSSTTGAPFDRAQVEAALDVAVREAVELDADEALAIYRDLRAWGDEACPPDYPYAGYEYWYAQCTAESGAVFSGYSYDYRYGGRDYGYDGLYIAAGIMDPAGQRLRATGVFERTTYRDGEGRGRDVLRLDGVFDWDGEAVSRWIEADLVPAVRITRSHEAARLLKLEGGIGGFPPPADAIEYTGVTFSEADACLEPTGILSVRVDAEWFDVEFGDDCDGCGRVGRRGVDVGVACADFSVWATWELRP